ncbi:MAG TPA: hypothetical protein VGM88_17140 [Kofleriaceae bacterium]|jgi:hypothetical protein
MKSDVELMEYADGEAADADVSSEPAAAKVAAVRELGELVRGSIERQAEGVSDAKFDAMWSRIDAATAAPRRRGWLDRYRGYVITGAASAAAVAALALVLGHGGRVDPGVATRPDAIDVRPVSLRSAPEIESLETPGGSPTVFTTDDEDGHTTVIWVTPADTVQGI